MLGDRGTRCLITQDPEVAEARARLTGRRGGPVALVPGARLGDWRLERKVGEGGMGEVYAAVHAVIGKRAAIKVVRPELCGAPDAGERFVQEARLVNQIGHPNIVDIFHVGRLGDGRPYLVMELLAGRTLGDRLADGRVPPGEAIAILLQICAGLAAAHARGIVHRDLKPDNVFLVEVEGGTRVKLVDWGIAKMKDAVPSAATAAGMIFGTPRYLSPEQARNRDVGERSDVYSLGAIAHELFLEAPPFAGDNVAELIAMHLREPVAPPSEVWPDIPPELESLLLAMLAKGPEERPSLDEVVARLHAVREALDRPRRVAAAPPAPAPAAPRAPRARIAAVAAALAGLVLAAGRPGAGGRPLAPPILATLATPARPAPAPVAAPTPDVPPAPPRGGAEPAPPGGLAAAAAPARCEPGSALPASERARRPERASRARRAERRPPRAIHPDATIDPF